MIRKLNNYVSFLLLYAVLLALALIPYYSNGAIILGGEGDYGMNFSLHARKSFFAWDSFYATGIQNMVPSGTGANILFLWLIEWLTESVAITNFTLIFSIYFLPFLAMYLVSKEIKASPFCAFLISFFYVTNPFMLYYLINLNQWNLFSVAVMPLLLWIILKYYHNNFKLFFFFGFLSTCFSFAYTNPPMSIIVQISIVFSIFLASFFHEGKLIIPQILKKYILVFVSFILFNIWWILSLYRVLSDATKLYRESFSAEAWLFETLRGHSPIIAKMFFLITIIPLNASSYDFFSYWYGTAMAKFVTLIPLSIIIFFVLMLKNKATRNLLNITILCIVLTVLFFVKGNMPPFGIIYSFLFKYVPVVSIFKTPVEKVGLFYLFVFTVLLLVILKNLNKHRYYKHTLSMFVIYLIFCSIPIATGNIVPDFKFEPYGIISRKYQDKAEYKKFREIVNNENSDYRILSMPGIANYQMLFPINDNKLYSGLDPVLWNTNKPFIAFHHQIHLLYDDTSSDCFKKMLGIYNIGKILVNEDLIPWFGRVHKESVPELKKIFQEDMPEEEMGSLTIYDNKEYFLPRIYVSPVVDSEWLLNKN